MIISILKQYKIEIEDVILQLANVKSFCNLITFAKN